MAEKKKLSKMVGDSMKNGTKIAQHKQIKQVANWVKHHA